MKLRIVKYKYGSDINYTPEYKDLFFWHSIFDYESFSTSIFCKKDWTTYRLSRNQADEALKEFKCYVGFFRQFFRHPERKDIEVVSQEEIPS